jgi:hypothetical protein
LELPVGVQAFACPSQPKGCIPTCKLKIDESPGARFPFLKGIDAMRVMSFAASSILTFAGMCLSAYGILQSDYKLLGVGLVLIVSAAVFAVLFVGSRWIWDRPCDE